MSYSGVNSVNVKMYNRSRLIKLLNDNGPASRKDIAIGLGLTAAAVTQICTQMIAEGILADLGELSENPRPGRKKMLVGLNYRYRHVLSISVEASETSISVSDLDGRDLQRKTLDTDTSVAPQVFLQKIAAESRRLLEDTGLKMSDVLGAGVSVPGAVDREHGISLHALRIWDAEVPVKTILQERLGIPVTVENNVKAFAEAELSYGTGRQSKNILFVKWGPGVGSAIVIENHVYDSHNSKTAEIGHLIVDRKGKLCRCGRRGCIETKVSQQAVAEEVRAQYSQESMPELALYTAGNPERINARNISEWAQLKDAALQKILQQAIDELALTVSNASTLMAPDQIVVYGRMFDIPGFLERFLDCCRNYIPDYKDDLIVKSDLSTKTSYIGSLALVFNEFINIPEAI